MSKRLCGLLTIRLSWQFASTLPLPTGAVPALAALVSHGTDSTNSENDHGFLLTAAPIWQRSVVQGRQGADEDSLACYEGNWGFLRHFPASALNHVRAEVAQDGPYANATWQEWQESFWVVKFEVGNARYHVALSSSAVPPASGWRGFCLEDDIIHIILVGNYDQNIVEMRQVQPRDLLDGTRKAIGCGKYHGEEYLPLVWVRIGTREMRR